MDGADESNKNPDDSPVLDKARNLMKSFAEAESPAVAPTPEKGGEPAPPATPSKGKGKGKNSNRLEDLKRKIKEAKEKSASGSGDAPPAATPPPPPAEEGVNDLISRLGKSQGKKAGEAGPSITHGQATQSKSGKLLELQAKLKAIDMEKRALKKDIGGKETKESSPAAAAPVAKTAPAKAAKDAANEAAKRAPAHEKYAHLAEKIEAPGGELPLPFKYKTLMEFFRNMDQAVSLYYNR